MAEAMDAAYEVGVLTFEGKDRAESTMDALRRAAGGRPDVDVSVVEHHPNGRFGVHVYNPQPTKGSHMTEGAVVGAALGGLLLGPFGLAAGLLGGVGVGATMQGRKKDDLELSDDFVRELRAALPPDSSAVLIVGDPEVVHGLMGGVHADGVVSVLELHHPLTEAQAAVLNEALTAARGSTEG
ncbi:MAG: DUF1269 domain-containing protein [Actinomycetota bacterium]